ncbi:FT-interacting protein 1-like protein [Tanacetum coccineum]
MGEIQLAVRFTCVSLANLMQMYAQPLIPNMHYIHPLSIFQQDSLRHQATQIVAMRLNRVEPPLRKESVEYMLDVDSTMWTLRKSKTNYCRLIEVLSCVASFVSGLITFAAGLDHLHGSGACFVSKCCLQSTNDHELDSAILDRDWGLELDEEFDSFLSSKNGDALKITYDRLRSMGSRIQTLVSDLATQGERIQNLVSWRDPRVTAMF